MGEVMHVTSRARIHELCMAKEPRAHLVALPKSSSEPAIFSVQVASLDVVDIVSHNDRNLNGNPLIVKEVENWQAYYSPQPVSQTDCIQKIWSVQDSNHRPKSSHNFCMC